MKKSENCQLSETHITTIRIIAIKNESVVKFLLS